jgi:molybdate transport system regulatory protein
MENFTFILIKMFKLKGRIWIESEDGTFIGSGRATLLQQIKETGSISEAARSMKMSYRHAWEQIDSMNRQSGKILVETQSGGQGGGGSRLTEHGEKVIKSYKTLTEKFEEFSKKESNKIKF